MVKTSNLFKKIRDTKGRFHVKMGIIKDRSSMKLTEDIKRRQQEYTELNKKDLYDPDKHNGVITHVDPGIRSQEGLRKHHYEQRLCGDRIPVELVSNPKR